MAQFKENNSGRPKGAKGKNNAELREAVRLIVEDSLPLLIEDMKTLTSNNRISQCIQLLKLVLPAQVEAEAKEDVPIFNIINLGSGTPPDDSEIVYKDDDEIVYKSTE